MLGRMIVPGSFLAALVAASGPAGAQSVAPCDPTRNATVTWRAADLDAKGSSTLIATHTLEVTMTPDPASSPGGGTVDDTTVKLSFPPGVQVFDGSTAYGRRQDYGGEQVGIISDSAGPVTVNASWNQDDVNGTCAGGASTTLQVQPAAPLKLAKRPARRVFGGPEWEWLTIIPPGSDLRPIEVRARSVKRARLPGGSLPFRTMTVGLRASEPRYDQGERRMRVPRLLVGVSANDEQIRIRGDIRIGSVREKPLGYDVQFVQGGRQIARVRLAGRCGVFDCKLRTLKVQR
jgi:hypothetical protein